MTSSGLIDVTLYTLTRRNLLIDFESSQNKSYCNFPSDRPRQSRVCLTSITAKPRSMELSGTVETRERESSTDNIMQPAVEMENLGKVFKETTIQVISESRCSLERPKSYVNSNQNGVWRQWD